MIWLRRVLAEVGDDIALIVKHTIAVAIITLATYGIARLMQQCISPGNCAILDVVEGSFLISVWVVFALTTLLRLTLRQSRDVYDDMRSMTLPNRNEAQSSPVSEGVAAVARVPENRAASSSHDNAGMSAGNGKAGHRSPESTVEETQSAEAGGGT